MHLFWVINNEYLTALKYKYHQIQYEQLLLDQHDTITHTYYVFKKTKKNNSKTILQFDHQVNSGVVSMVKNAHL